MNDPETIFDDTNGDVTPGERAGAACMPAPKVSVIIPLYYAEEYIDDLLSQLREQPLKEIEVVCVVDGSPDGTLEIVKRHAEADVRIQWLYQENAGAGAARNVGLERARGEYLAFLDADDLYDPLFLEKMYEAATYHDVDLVVCQFKRVDCTTGVERSNEGFHANRVPVDKAFSPESLGNPLLDIASRVTNRFFSRSLFTGEGLRFSETRVANDLFVAYASIAASKKIVAIPDSLITVRRYVNPESISSNRMQHSEDVLVNMRDVFAWLEERGLSERYRPSFISVWTGAVHYEATYKRNKRLIELAAETLACKEPWRSMSDAELWQVAGLDTGIFSIKRFIINLKPQSETSAIEHQRIDNERAAIAEIVHLLNTKYGKQLPEKPNVFNSAAAYLRSKGLRHSIATFARHIRKA